MLSLSSSLPVAKTRTEREQTRARIGRRILFNWWMIDIWWCKWKEVVWEAGEWWIEKVIERCSKRLYIHFYLFPTPTLSHDSTTVVKNCLFFFFFFSLPRVGKWCDLPSLWRWYHFSKRVISPSLKCRRKAKKYWGDQDDRKTGGEIPSERIGCFGKARLKTKPEYALLGLHDSSSREMQSFGGEIPKRNVESVFVYWKAKFLSGKLLRAKVFLSTITVDMHACMHIRTYSNLFLSFRDFFF